MVHNTETNEYALNKPNVFEKEALSRHCRQGKFSGHRHGNNRTVARLQSSGPRRVVGHHFGVRKGNRSCSKWYSIDVCCVESQRGREGLSLPFHNGSSIDMSDFPGLAG